MPAVCILQLICVIIAANFVATQVTVGPTNTVVKLGRPLALGCRANIPAGDFVAWDIYVDGDTGTRIYKSGEGVLDTVGYDIVEEYPDRYDLIVNTATKDYAHLYSCHVKIVDNWRHALIVVVDTVVCSRDLTVEIGDNVEFQCTVDFYGQITPRLDLTLDGSTLASATTAEANTLGLEYNMTAAKINDDTEYICEVSFDSSGDEGSNDIPDYTDNCKTHIYVNHAPYDVQISPNPSHFPGGVLILAIGDNVTCSARGRPVPQISFSPSSGTNPDVEGNRMMIGPEHIGIHTYSCVAENYAGSKWNTVNRQFTLEVPQEVTEPVTEEEQTTTTRSTTTRATTTRARTTQRHSSGPPAMIRHDVTAVIMQLLIVTELLQP